MYVHRPMLVRWLGAARHLGGSVGWRLQCTQFLGSRDHSPETGAVMNYTLQVSFRVVALALTSVATLAAQTQSAAQIQSAAGTVLSPCVNASPGSRWASCNTNAAVAGPGGRSATEGWAEVSPGRIACLFSTN